MKRSKITSAVISPERTGSPAQEDLFDCIKPRIYEAKFIISSIALIAAAISQKKCLILEETLNKNTWILQF